MKIIKRIFSNILVALTIVIAVGLLNYALLWIFAFLGYAAFIFSYLLIIGGLILFYKLTSILKEKGWIFLSFGLNFIFWVTEQALIESEFSKTIFYQDEKVSMIFVLILGALLFALNKSILDEIMIFFGAKTKEEMMLLKILKRKMPVANKV
ncbi:hypothetical protein [Tenacibaculum agarivorans]|uniref:hypothetical protein n=1 Tax=Tenacibaculum agarivorans TaxID=1908389 RepID=UPI00094BBF21|nr:hypothetical protein [Tenacibaculum agarivorans]